jgi:hypothetical protein
MNNKISYLDGCIDSLANDVNIRLDPNPRISPLIMVLTNNNAVGGTETDGQKANENPDEQKKCH